MPSKKKKYNARFPAGRIKKIMQTDEEIGKVAQAVPVIISRTLELFVDELITKTMQITTMKNARTLSPHHIYYYVIPHIKEKSLLKTMVPVPPLKQCILSESRFDFLKDLVKSVPEVATSDDDLGSFSDNSLTVQPRQRSNSRDVTNSRTTKEEDPGAPSTAGQSFEVQIPVLAQAATTAHSRTSEMDESSESEEDDVDMAENSHDNSKETLPPETANSFVFPRKGDSDSEDYDT